MRWNDESERRPVRRCGTRVARVLALFVTGAMVAAVVSKAWPV